MLKFSVHSCCFNHHKKVNLILYLIQDKIYMYLYDHATAIAGSFLVVSPLVLLPMRFAFVVSGN